MEEIDRRMSDEVYWQGMQVSTNTLDDAMKRIGAARS